MNKFEMQSSYCSGSVSESFYSCSWWSNFWFGYEVRDVGETSIAEINENSYCKSMQISDVLINDLMGLFVLSKYI